MPRPIKRTFCPLVRMSNVRARGIEIEKGDVVQGSCAARVRILSEVVGCSAGRWAPQSGHRARL